MIWHSHTQSREGWELSCYWCHEEAQRWVELNIFYSSCSPQELIAIASAILRTRDQSDNDERRICQRGEGKENV